MDFCIIDIETTGFSKTYDRIIEVAVLRIDSAGNLLRSYESLVNPNRDVGATHIHGLTASSLSKAPEFNDIAYSIVDILNNSIIVAHNKNFDLGFLNSEFERANINIPELNGICTLQLSKYLFPELPSRKLQVLCQYFDILVENLHQAFSDCEATMHLFLKMYDSYINDFGIEDFQSKILGTNYFSARLESKISKIEFKRSDAKDLIKKDESRMQNLLLRIPDNYDAKDYNISEYLNLLDEILEDRLITEDEYKEIEKFSQDFHIPSSKMIKIHEEYFRRLTRFYLSDKVLSEFELTDLNKVSDLLQIGEDKKELIIELEKAELSLDIANSSVNHNSYLGKSVCFTGQLISKINGQLITRELAHILAMENGLIIKKGVTKELDMLIVADPNTQSGKAKKAKSYGIRIVAETVFWNQLGVIVN